MSCSYSSIGILLDFPLFSSRLLLDRGASIDAVDRFGYTPFHVAMDSGKVEPVKMLLERGAFIYDVHCNGPLDRAVDFGNLDILALLLDCAAKQGIDTVTYVRETGKYGKNVLHFVRHWDDLQSFGQWKGCFELLVQHGALLEAQDREGNTPLHTHATSGFAPGSKEFKEANMKAQLNIKAVESILDCARMQGKKDILWIENHAGRNSAQHARYEGFTAVAKELDNIMTEFSARNGVASRSA